ncbi:MAG: TonB-dependent receptor, partial [Bacteroidetes bacterium]|nr:TonB-dependent receptor [Bacteroidota bacterium]
INKFSEVIFEPRLSFSQRFYNDFRFEVLAEIKSQTSSQIIDLQNDFLGVEKRRWVLSNDSDIPILKSKQVSIGVHYNKNKLLISAEAYLKNVDGITTRSQGFQNQYQFVNEIGKYKVKGIDFLINKQFNLISTWLSYSFSKNDYTFNTLNNGNTFPNNADIRHAATFAGTYTLKNLKFALGFNWHSGKPTTVPQQNNNIINGSINYTDPNSDNLSDYLRTDFSVTYNFNLSDNIKTSIGASVWNVFNKKNIINTYYTIDSNEIINKVEIQSLGITPNVSFRVYF